MADYLKANAFDNIGYQYNPKTSISVPIMQKIQAQQNKYNRKQAWNKVVNTYLSAAASQALTSFGNQIFGDSEVGNLASQAVGNIAGDLFSNKFNLNKFNSNGLIANTAFGFATNGLSSSKHAGSRAAGSAINSIGSQVATNLLNGSKAFSGFSGANIGGMALSTINAALKPKTEYSGEKGKITSTLDTIDSVGTAALSAIPGVGQVLGLAKVGLDTGFKALNNIGYGTDAMTKTDAILGSNMIGEALLPLSLINGKFGKTTARLNPRTFQENQDLAKIESAYTDTVQQGNEAWKKQGKKYGMLSHGAYNKANKLINWYGNANEALLNMDLENKIADSRIQANGLSNQQYNIDLAGGLDPRTLQAKKGAKLQKKEVLIEECIPEFSNGGSIQEKQQLTEEVIPEFQNGGELLPEVIVQPSEDDMKVIIEKRWPAIKNTSEYHIYRDPEFTSKKTGAGSIEYIRQPEIKYDNGFILKNPNKTPTIVFNPDTNTIDDIQLDILHHFRETDPKYQQVLKPFQDYILNNRKGDVFWNSQLGSKFRESKQNPNKYEDFLNNNITDEHIVQGIDGVLRDLLAPNDIRKKQHYQSKDNADKQWLFDDTSKQLFQNIKDYLETGELKPQQFKNGGELNIIPEGALHKNLHHMENDENITKKGIPVVSENKDGEMTQYAEIERSEIILRLDLTQKLEKMLKKYNSDISQSEKDEIAEKAGQIMVDELLNKTVDNTNELL